MTSKFACAALVALALASPALGQLGIAVPVAAPVSSGVAIQFDEEMSAEQQQALVQAAMAQAQAQAQSGGQPNPSDPKQKRLQKIQQLQFDRRPSVILKAWLDPAPKPPKLPELPPGAAQPAPPAAQAADAAKPAEAAAPAADAAKPEEKPAEAPAADPPATETAPAEQTPEEKAAAEKAAAEKAAAEKAAADKAAAEKAAVEKAAADKARLERAAIEQVRADLTFDYELKLFARNVTLGDWSAVKDYLTRLDKNEARELYGRMLEMLRAGPNAGQPQINPQLLQRMVLDSADMATMQAMLSAGGQGGGAAFVERNQFGMADIAGLVVSAPHDLDENTFNRLGTLLRQAIAAGNDLDVLLRALNIDVEGSEPKLARRQTAQLLFASGEEIRGGKYLPTIEEATKEQDAEALNLLARHYLALHGKEHKAEQLEQAWRATQAVLPIPIELQPEDDDQAPPAAPAAPAAPAVGGAAPAQASAPRVISSGTLTVSGTTTVRAVRAAVAATVLAQAPAAAAPATITLTPVAASPATPAAAAAPAAAGQVAAPADPAAVAAAEAKKAAREKRARLRQAKEQALRRAVELAPRVRKELGQTWLNESFSAQVERGREILTAIGTLVSTNLASRPTDAQFRLKSLQLQQSAVEALLRAAPERATEWKETLSLLASGWLREAQVSSELDQRERMGPGWQRDRYGNYFFVEDETQVSALRYSEGMAQPIKTNELLEVRPNEQWLALVSADLAPKFASTFAQLYLKVNEDAKAFPFIEQLAATHPDKARDLAHQFLRVWISNHNPNEQRDNGNPFFYYWGYERRAERIPLTRSKQERNLQELAEWIKRLRALPIGELNEELLTRAFTTAHSKAEVYKLESIENVFGELEHLKPRALAEMIQQMRGNLATVWQAPDVQKQAGTNRREQDIKAEVLRGFEVARAVCQKGLAKYPDHWALVQAEAAVLHDENEYQQQLEKRSEFSAVRLAALKRFAQAAELYGQAVAALPEDEQSLSVYEQWFYASLGSVDLPRITGSKVPDPKQPALIRQALLALPGETAEHHLSQFANDLFTRASSAKAELKHRYLKAGLEVVGDHKLALEARKLMDYYGDLVTEIKLETRIDGSDNVGHKQPFGVFVNLLHTKEIERESGGFGRYLQNQANNQSYYYNFGRPLENYRDKFRDIVTQALGEHFEVISITYQDAEVNSRALPEYGWRITPYAYLLLKAKGPEVDKLPPVRLDLDFLDTSGYVILPVESPAVPLDAKSDSAPQRPATEIRITQTLDERQAAEGKLLLEVRATARGLVPDLTELVDLKPAGFDIVKTEDGGVSVTQFDKDARENTIDSERIWTIALAASAEQPDKRPDKFHFAVAKAPVKEMLYQRYDDADLVTVEPQVALAERYAARDLRWLWMALTIGVVSILTIGLLVWMVRRRRPAPVSRFAMPRQVTPFTVIGLLRDIQANNGLSEPAHKELSASISRLERHYFLASEQVEPNLQDIAERWVRETSRS
ncbi:MAG: hypothetical protein K2Y37_19820 [Pirellulales bacterium]|nr:hypothetical protein [Pirellulales bacterium]